MNKPASRFLKVLLIAAGLFAGFIAVSLALFWWNVRAKELPPESAKDFIRLEPGDRVLHAYTGARWLDSQRYFVVQADPSGFDERIRMLCGQGPDRAVRMTIAPGRELWRRSEPVPSWWDVDSLDSAVAVDAGSKNHPHSGQLSIFSKERGLIYVLDR